MQKMLETALKRWRAMPERMRYLDYDPAQRRHEIRRAAQSYPANGLVLRVFTRDLPRSKKFPADDWRAGAWNVDSLWYRAQEAESMLPSSPRKGAQIDWPQAVIERLVRHNLVDNVRGQTNGYRADHVQAARMTATVTATSKTSVWLQLEGESRTTTTGAWPQKGRYDSLKSNDPHARGVQTKLRGVAVFDRKSKRFQSMEIVAMGTRWGKTMYNFRQDDLDESEIGFVILLDAQDVGGRVTPAEFGAYRW